MSYSALALFLPKCFASTGTRGVLWWKGLLYSQSASHVREHDVDSFECGSLGACCFGNLAGLYKVVGFLKLAEDGFAVGGADVVGGGEVHLAVAFGFNGVLGDGGVPGVVEGVAGDVEVFGVFGLDADEAVDELAAVDVDSFAFGEFQQGGDSGFAFFGFVEDGAACEADVGGLLETDACAVPWGMSAKGVSRKVDESGVFDQEVAVVAGVDAIATEGDAVAAGEMYIVFLAPDNVAGDGEEAGWSGLVGFFDNPDVAALW